MGGSRFPPARDTPSPSSLLPADVVIPHFHTNNFPQLLPSSSPPPSTLPLTPALAPGVSFLEFCNFVPRLLLGMVLFSAFQSAAAIRPNHLAFTVASTPATGTNILLVCAIVLSLVFLLALMLNTPGQHVAHTPTIGAMQDAINAAAIRIQEGRVNGGNNGGGLPNNLLSQGRHNANGAHLGNIHRHLVASQNGSPSNLTPRPSAVLRPQPSPNSVIDAVAKQILIRISKHLAGGNAKEFIQGFIEEQAEADLPMSCEAELAREVNECLTVTGAPITPENLQSGSSFLDAVAYNAMTDFVEHGATTLPGTLDPLGPDEAIPGSSLTDTAPPCPARHLASTSDIGVPSVITDLILPQIDRDSIRKQILELKNERTDVAKAAAQTGSQSQRGKPRGSLLAAFQPGNGGRVNADQAYKDAMAANMKFGSGNRYQVGLYSER